MKKDCFIYINEEYLVYGDKKDFYNNYDFILNEYIVENIQTILGKNLKEKITQYLCRNYSSNIYINISTDNFNFFPKILIEQSNGEMTSTNDCITFKKIYNVMRYNCCKCNKKAVWSYEPMINNNDGSITPKNSYFCNKHVHKKCSTNNFNYYYFENKNDFLERVNNEITNSSKKEKKLLSLRLFNKNLKNLENKTLKIKNIIGYKKIIKFINKTEENILKFYEVVPHKPGVEYSYEKNGYIIYKDENYSFIPED